jgi:CelD/BcsL family acetyltransferase involved in cellulose biosynthesis
LRVVRLAERDPRWGAFVANHPEGLIYHHPAWLQVLKREYDRPSLCLACEDDEGQLRGVLPLLRTRGFPFAASAATARRLSSLPRTPVAGPLSTDDQASAALVRAAVEVVRSETGTRFELKLPAPVPDGVADGLACEPWRLSYSIELPAQPDTLRFGNSRNHARIKWALHKAQRHGVQVRKAESANDLRTWYPLYVRTMQLHSVPQRPYRFFAAAWDLLRPLGMMQLLLAERQTGERRQLLAGSLFLMFGQTVFYAFNGCESDGRSLRANDVIQWQAITDACQAGFRHYDLGEVVETQEGLHEFKSKWGAESRRLYRYYFPSPGSVQATAMEASGSSVGRLAKAAWRRLPWRVTAVLGDWVYSYL